MGDMLSQDEINALLGSANNNTSNNNSLSDSEIKKMKNIATEFISSACKTLEALLNKKIDMSEMDVRNIKVSELKYELPDTTLSVKIEYISGIIGSNLLILSYKDGKIISNIMMGGDGQVGDEELSDLDKSALGEAMNQAVGNISNIFSKIINEKVEINTPEITSIDRSRENFIKDFGFEEEEEITLIAFRVNMENLVDNKMISVLPNEFARKLCDNYSSQKEEDKKLQSKPLSMSNGKNMETFNSQNYAGVDARPVEFQQFSNQDIVQQKENIDLIMDVPLEVTVEMGRTIKKIEEILEFVPGTIIELDKIAGDPIDVIVNGKFVAKGEVVVIDENYGIRITDIINAKNRI